MAGILELDKQRLRRQAGIDDSPKEDESPADSIQPRRDIEHDSSEYEEIEITDDEGHDAGDEADEKGRHAKRQRTEGPSDEEMSDPEAEMLLQLQMMGGEYGADENDGEGHEDEVALSKEDAKELFKDMLDDFKISPFSPWEKLLEDGKVFDDPRYMALGTTKARKETWEEWSREKIQEMKKCRAREEKVDPKISYMVLLESQATPKLFWPEFKRKFKKETCMKEFCLSDKEREKWYREYINSLKMPTSRLKSDLLAFLKSFPATVLNSSTSSSHLPLQVRTDMRYVALRPEVRDPILEAYIQTLGPSPGDEGQRLEAELAEVKAKEARKKREMALEQRNRGIDEQKRRDQWNLEIARARMKAGEREIEEAMIVTKTGLKTQLQ